jgi:hypothetical protein
MRKVWFVIALATLFWSCGNSKKQVNNDSESFYISMEKTACFGQCPIYTLEVIPEGYLLLDARRFNRISGKFKASLSESEKESLLVTVSQLPWNSYDEEYLTGYSDLPSTILTYAQLGDTIRVRYESDKAPQGLLELANTLEDWKKNKYWESLILE